MTIDRVSGAGFALFAALVLWESSKIPFGTLADPGPGALPMLLGIVLLVCSVVLVLAGKSGERLYTIEWRPERRHGAAILGALAFMALAMERLGYRITIFIALLFLVAIVEKKGWIAGTIFAAGFSLGTFGLFHTLLHVQLPRGPFGS